MLSVLQMRTALQQQAISVAVAAVVVAGLQLLHEQSGCNDATSVDRNVHLTVLRHAVRIIVHGSHLASHCKIPGITSVTCVSRQIFVLAQSISPFCVVGTKNEFCV